MIGTVAGVFTVGWMPVLTPLVYCAYGIACALSLLCWQRCAPSWFLFGLALGFCYGNAWGFSLLAARLPATLDGQSLVVQGTIIELPQRREFSGGGQRQRFAFELETPACGEDGGACLPAGSKILLSLYGDEQVQVGQRWRWQAKLKRPWGLANPGSFNYQAWLAQHRFSATGNIKAQGRIQLVDQRGPGLWHQHLRQYLSQRLPTADTASNQVLRALTVGDRSAVTQANWRQLQSFGLNHLVVISGLHVGMVAAVGFYLGLLLGRCGCLLGIASNSYTSAQLGAASMALAYSALAGFALPTMRALLMLACVQLFSLYRRQVNLWRSLHMALVFIAVLDPLATHSAGFWLSFGAVALIAWLLSAWPQLRGVRRFLLLQAGLSLATGLAGSFWFGGGSWLAPLANLLAVPVVTLLVAPLCLLGAALVPLSVTAAHWCWYIAGWPVAGFFAVAEAVEQFGVNPWLQHQPGPLAVLLSLLAILLLLLPRGMPLRWLALPLLLPQFLPHNPPIAPDSMEVTVFDVGQGLAVLVQTEDIALLYDTGAGDPAGPNMASSVILPWMRRHGLDELDLLVISHADRDHASGVGTLAQNLVIKELWYGDSRFPLALPQHPCEAGREQRYGVLNILQLHPVAGQTTVHSNDRSCVLLLDFSGYRVMLPGDISKDIEHQLRERWGAVLAADLLLAPHHGSLSSSSTGFIRAVAPTVVVFSAGYQNRFQHPRPRVLARYRGSGIQDYETAESGALSFVVKDGILRSVSEYRQRRAYYWH
jgi:competence protein ComEC